MKYVLAPLAFAAALAVGYFVYRDSQQRLEPTSEEKVEQVLAVEVIRVRRQPIEERIELAGGLEAQAAVQIRARISGYITKLPYDVGDFVEQGKIVVELDDSKQQQAVSKAQATLEVAIAQLKAQQAREALAKKDVVRQTELSESGVITAQQLDTSKSKLTIAEAESQLEQSRVDEAESDLLRAKLSLQETSVTAAMSGYVAERFVEVGDLSSPADPILRIIDLSTVRAVVNVPERDYEKVQLGQNATITLPALPGQLFTGKVIRKAPVLNPQTRTAIVHVEIRNPQNVLKHGFHARVSIVSGTRRRAQVVPIAALLEHGAKPALYVIDGNPPRSMLQEVRTGFRDGNVVEIVSGLEANARVVTLGSRMIRHGQEVHPLELPWPKTVAERTASRSTNVTPGGE